MWVAICMWPTYHHTQVAHIRETEVAFCLDDFPLQFGNWLHHSVLYMAARVIAGRLGKECTFMPMLDSVQAAELSSAEGTCFSISAYRFQSGTSCISISILILNWVFPRFCYHTDVSTPLRHSQNSASIRTYASHVGNIKETLQLHGKAFWPLGSSSRAVTSFWRCIWYESEEFQKILILRMVIVVRSYRYEQLLLR